jgi:multisubunit Na+/H+ antiporter MnhG subunit
VKGIVVEVLVWASVAGLLASVVGFVAGASVYDRLHYAGAASSVPPFLLAVAVLLRRDFTTAGISALLVAIFLLVFNSVVTHATARVAYVRERGSLEPPP